MLNDRPTADSYRMSCCRRNLSALELQAEMELHQRAFKLSYANPLRETFLEIKATLYVKCFLLINEGEDGRY